MCTEQQAGPRGVLKRAQDLPDGLNVTPARRSASFPNWIALVDRWQDGASGAHDPPAPSSDPLAGLPGYGRTRSQPAAARPLWLLILVGALVIILGAGAKRT